MGIEVAGGEARFRADVRAWIKDAWDDDLTLREWWARLHDAGLSFPTWPERWGGLGVSQDLAVAVTDELGAAGVIGPPHGLGQIMGAPVVMNHGTEEQAERWVRRLATGEESWCQFFSEPEAGSDLAGLRTRAEQDGDEWVVNGQKVWTSGARHADRGMLVARTNWDVPKHRGLSYFIIDVDQPGIEIRPLKQMNGQAEFNEVFFSDARVGADGLIGEDGQGWAAAITTLAYERAGVTQPHSLVTPDPGAKHGQLDRRVGDLVRESHERSGTESPDVTSARFMIGLARSKGRTDDPVVREQLAQLHTLDEIFRYTTMRAQAAVDAGKRPGPEANTMKISRTNASRLAQRLGLELLGPAGTLAGADAPSGGIVQEMALTVPSASIASGSDEIQRNILGERALGLPKDISVDRDIPFREVRSSSR